MFIFCLSCGACVFCCYDISWRGACQWLAAAFGGGLMFLGASSSVLSAFRYLVPPPAAYFPAKESRQSSPGCGPDPGSGGGGIGTGLASPLVATRRFSLRPQYFGHWPLGRISPLQNLKAVALPSAVLMPPFGLPSSTRWTWGRVGAELNWKFSTFLGSLCKTKSSESIEYTESTKGAKSKESTESKEENTRRLNPKAIL